MNVELLFLTKYKMNPFELFGNLTLLDFDVLIRRIENQIKEENRKKQGKKDLGTALVTLRDLLNYMTL